MNKIQIKKVAIYIFLIACIILIISVIGLWQRGWFMEMIPDTGSAESWGSRKLGEILEEEFPTGEKRWHDGTWTFDTSILKVAPKGITIENTLDVTINQGTLKFVVYDLGKSLKREEYMQMHRQGPGDSEKVFEQAITESGSYQFDFADWNPDDIYFLSIMETMDGDNDYRYTWTWTSSAPRWYRLHDKWLTKLPFVDYIWETSPTWEDDEE